MLAETSVNESTAGMVSFSWSWQKTTTSTAGVGKMAKQVAGVGADAAVADGSCVESYPHVPS